MSSENQADRIEISVSVHKTWDLPATLEAFNSREFKAALGRLVTATYMESLPKTQCSSFNTLVWGAGHTSKPRNVSDPKSTTSTGTTERSVFDTSSPMKSSDGGVAEDGEESQHEKEKEIVEPVENLDWMK
jgi:hypothetical protein